MVFLELIFLFSPFSATKTKLLPPVMHDSESSCFLSKKKKTLSSGISLLLISSHTNQKFDTETFYFFPQSEYIATENMHGYLLFRYIIS